MGVFLMIWMGPYTFLPRPTIESPTFQKYRRALVEQLRTLGVVPRNDTTALHQHLCLTTTLQSACTPDEVPIFRHFTYRSEFNTHYLTALFSNDSFPRNDHRLSSSCA